MEFLTTLISGLLIIKPDVFADERGYFFESYNEEKFRAGGVDVSFRQDNESKSKKSVVRGLHCQAPPFSQGKLVRVIKGSVIDIAVDIRKNSPTYGKYVPVLLSEENKTMFWIPAGFAHGFVTLEDDTIFSYKCTEVYNKAAERSILWNDPDLAIDWGVNEPVVSERDKQSPLFRDFVTPF
jgi:dTDP-4-dehydrorhamnose 3,5-epimerase